MPIGSPSLPSGAASLAHAIGLALVVAAVLAAAARWGSYVAGGSDSYCYVHQAERWASGRLHVVDPLALAAPWPDAPASFAPAGHVPSPTVPGALVPICPAGLSILMALFVLVGGPGAAFVVVPLLGAVLIVATAAVGARFSPRVGLGAAVLVACSPVFLYQLFQPMSDVPAAACWMLAVASTTGTSKRAGVVAGAAAGVAILIRPNLVPLGFVLGLFLLLRPERPWRRRVETAAMYAAGCALGCVAVALIHQSFYGSPFASGYGSVTALFSTDHVRPNVERYLAWVWETQTPFIALACLAPVLLPGPMTALVTAWVVVNAGLYLPYVVFDDWSALRFFLPSIPLLLVLAVASADALVRRLARATESGVRSGYAVVVVAVVVVAVSAIGLRQASDRLAFRLRALEARFASVGRFVARRLPAHAVVVASVHSGSVRYYAGRPTLVWDGLDPLWLERAMGVLRERGLEPFFVLEAGEEAPFRARFGQDASSVLARLDWPPMAEVASQVHVYAPADRERSLQGQSRPTEYVR
jgi:hypothetical protein